MPIGLFNYNVVKIEFFDIPKEQEEDIRYLIGDLVFSEMFHSHNYRGKKNKGFIQSSAGLNVNDFIYYLENTLDKLKLTFKHFEKQIEQVVIYLKEIKDNDSVIEIYF